MEGYIKCSNKARPMLLPLQASRAECSWSELFKSLETSITTSPHWAQTALAHIDAHALFRAHKDNLNPAVYFNYGAKHSIYRPLRPQQTTAHSLFSLFPESP